jgi:hypothetical protein
MIDAQVLAPSTFRFGEYSIFSTVRRVVKLWPFALISIVLVFAAASDTFNLDPVQRVALPYRYSLTAWEIQTLPDKWLHKLTTLLPWNGQSDQEKQDDLLAYFTLREKLGAAFDYLNRAMADPHSNSVVSLQAEVDRVLKERESLRASVEETIESAISTAFQETGLGWWGDIVFPPVDIRMAGPPTILLTSPRDHIKRQHEVLLEPDISLLDRERLEDLLMAEDDNVSAASFQIGGLATYPASVIDVASLEDTFRTAAHEWTHHYMVFHAFGQKMFTSAEMVTLNETTADIVGRELGDRAREIVLGEIDEPAVPDVTSSLLPPDNTADDGEKEFDFNSEMRETRLHVDELLAQGKIDGAETYMEERRLIFIDNGIYIRKLNQAYFAFNGSYAESPTSSSPIGGQLNRFRELMPDLAAFIVEMSDISSYRRFLDRLAELETEVGT